MENNNENEQLLKRKLENLVAENQNLHQLLSLSGNDKNIISQLQILEERYHVSENLTETGTWEFDLTKKTIWASPGAFQIYGLERLNNGIFDIRTLLKLQNEEEVEKLDKAVELLIKKNKPYDIFYKILKENQSGQKETRIINSKASLIFDSDNKPTKVIGIIRDVTSQTKYERDLIRTKEKAEESEKLKSVFLENMSHEIRTPMNAIIGYTELLNIGTEDPGKRKEYTEIIKNKGDFLLSLIDDIIEISKFESGHITISRTECNLNYLLKELWGLFNQKKAQLGKDNVQLNLTIPDVNKPYSFYTDSGRLQQVLMNLLDNALKFTEKGIIEFGYKTIDENTKLQFFVIDTGSGIPKEKHKIIFERYRQVEDTTALRSSGSGLGLTICKSIVELLEGKIWLDPDRKEGASFNFTLPVIVEKPLDAHEVIDKPYEVFQLSNFIWKDKVIVVAEDDDVNYMFLETLLHETQAQVIRAINGFQVIELVKTINKIDMILMDIKMPDMNGYEASTKVKELNPKIPIIAQTAYSMKEDKTKTLEAGCDDYVAKPIVIETLLNKMNKYFQ